MNVQPFGRTTWHGSCRHQRLYAILSHAQPSLHEGHTTAVGKMLFQNQKVLLWQWSYVSSRHQRTQRQEQTIEWT